VPHVDYADFGLILQLPANSLNTTTVGRDNTVYVQLHSVLVLNGKPDAGLRMLQEYLRLFPQDPNRKTVEEMSRKLRAQIP